MWWGIEHIRSSATIGIYHARDLLKCKSCLPLFPYGHCLLYLQGAHHVANTPVMLVYYSWNNVPLPLKWIHATRLWVSCHCVIEKTHCCHPCWLASRRAGCCFWSMFSARGMYKCLHLWGTYICFLKSIPTFFNVVFYWKAWECHHLDTLRSGKEASQVPVELHCRNQGELRFGHLKSYQPDLWRRGFLSFSYHLTWGYFKVFL